MIKLVMIGPPIPHDHHHVSFWFVRYMTTSAPNTYFTGRTALKTPIVAPGHFTGGKNQ